MPSDSNKIERNIGKYSERLSQAPKKSLRSNANY